MLRRAVKGNRRLKDVVNQALRIGLAAREQPKKGKTAPDRTPVHDSGRCLLADLDCVAEALAIAEGDG